MTKRPKSTFCPMFLLLLSAVDGNANLWTWCTLAILESSKVSATVNRPFIHKISSPYRKPGCDLILLTWALFKD